MVTGPAETTSCGAGDNGSPCRARELQRQSFSENAMFFLVGKRHAFACVWSIKSQILLHCVFTLLNVLTVKFVLLLTTILCLLHELKTASIVAMGLASALMMAALAGVLE